jgi:hypothetical protein
MNTGIFLGKQLGKQIGAATIMILVANDFVDDDMLVEIEVDAFAE